MSKKCDICDTELKPLFTGEFCPNEKNHFDDTENTDPGSDGWFWWLKGASGPINWIAGKLGRTLHSSYPANYQPNLVRPCLHTDLYHVSGNHPSGKSWACCNCGDFIDP